MTEGTSPLLDYLTQLQEDPDLQRTFWEDPQAAMAGAGLTTQQIEVVLGRDPQAIGAAVGSELGQAFPSVVYVDEHTVELRG